ncbi:metal-sensitive transcriptional regulator [Spirochaetia bacterium 38H-sp]|uniref:Metal-sensitive transcriptional regulator n=1 Tax=Rarispira pelagica TaxID=3141764 RepID=A0ABU9UBR3_9SPIR
METCQSCSIEERHAHHDKETKDALIKRLNRIEGQIRGIKKMIEEDVYCDGILNQITSVRAALSGVSTLLLDAHIRSCVKEQIMSGEEGVIPELIATIRRMIK